VSPTGIVIFVKGRQFIRWTTFRYLLKGRVGVLADSESDDILFLIILKKVLKNNGLSLFLRAFLALLTAVLVWLY
jgi:hypothetical protein